MILSDTVIANWEHICKQNPHVIDESNQHENHSRIPHSYTPGNHVMICNTGKRKIDPPHEAPFLVTHIYSDCTVQVQRVVISVLIFSMMSLEYLFTANISLTSFLASCFLAICFFPHQSRFKQFSS
jgi:hypothetical protein